MNESPPKDNYAQDLDAFLEGFDATHTAKFKEVQEAKATQAFFKKSSKALKLFKSSPGGSPGRDISRTNSDDGKPRKVIILKRRTKFDSRGIPITNLPPAKGAYEHVITEEDEKRMHR